ncbi:Cytochrome c, mono- and diheme variants [Hahella chejuensis KCTC 2396]|uniref:Cytochrome c, mono-and diheme variants n=1 Tax=Hahella chejuensis (strain KCTC 2396) TaxID=349521 RepID=Q2SDZ6_HAHCH|nr:cytochrome D1 domain-containing protein [Hahella chejuensis]ABC31128.1 Cytochrome c, mono- and diheme variants [Hahella chejuensis KCTC 2396]
MKLSPSLLFATLTLSAFTTPASAADSTSNNAASDTEALYQTHCAACHHPQRLGGLGPALLPESLGRIRPKQAQEVILHGRAATQMPAFADRITDNQASQLAAYLFQPAAVTPQWTDEDIRASHIIHFPKSGLGDKPVFDADLMNLFIVVESGDHHATLLDGDAFKPIHRFKTRYALHGGPKFSPDGRYVYFASRDGWISQFDIYNLKTVAEIRVGLNTRNLALSADGKWVMVANYLPQNLVLLNADRLSPLKTFPVSNREQGSRVSAVYTAPQRNSFIAAMKDIRELWEIRYDQPAFPVRKITTEDYLDDFFFDQDYRHLIGASRSGESGQVIDLESGATIATLNLPGMPHLGSGISWETEQGPLMMTPHLKEGALSIINMKDWSLVKTLPTLGPGFFTRSHDGSPYIWVDVFFGPNKDKLHVIDKETLEIIATLAPEPGKTAAHVEFTKDGRFALVSLWEDNGALIVYDALTLKEVTRLPMSKPSGKYNVYNKTHYVRGTSH